MPTWVEALVLLSCSFPFLPSLQPPPGSSHLLQLLDLFLSFTQTWGAWGSLDLGSGHGLRAVGSSPAWGSMLSGESASPSIPSPARAGSQTKSLKEKKKPSVSSALHGAETTDLQSGWAARCTLPRSQHWPSALAPAQAQAAGHGGRSACTSARS